MDARYAVGTGVWPVEVTAYASRRPEPEGRWSPSLWLNFKYHGRSESLSSDALSCRRARDTKIVTCVGSMGPSGGQRGPSSIQVRLLKDRILAMEIVELEPPARYERPKEGWPKVVAEFRHRGCRWGEPLRCE